MTEPNPNNSCKTKKNFTGFYTEVNPKKLKKKNLLSTEGTWLHLDNSKG